MNSHQAFRRRGLAAFLAVLTTLLLTIPSFAQTPFPAPGVLLRDANLRGGAGINYAVVGAGRTGQQVTISETNADASWYHLSTGEWIAAFLVEVKTAEPAPAADTANGVMQDTPAAGALANAGSDTVGVVATANRAANLRSGPGTTFPVVGSVQNGQALPIMGQSAAGDWYQLSGGQWIAAFLVNQVAPGSTAIPAPTPTPIPAQIEAPAPVQQPAVPTANPLAGQRRGAICRDGTSSGATGRGACSHHGGVDHWLYY